jgi:hypothetical protein
LRNNKYLLHTINNYFGEGRGYNWHLGSGLRIGDPELRGLEEGLTLVTLILSSLFYPKIAVLFLSI